MKTKHGESQMYESFSFELSLNPSILKQKH